ncbi:Craniofacial development protein 2, partial [Operophtera brumata]
FFAKKPQRRWTWVVVVPNRTYRNEIDFVLSSDRSIVKDVSAINKINYSSDHRMVLQTAIEKHTSLRTAKQGIPRGKQWINGLQDQHGKKQNSRDKMGKSSRD